MSKSAVRPTDSNNTGNSAIMTVMVVEDSLPERARVVAILSKHRYHIIEANHGHDALDILQRTHVDLIISDWRMPKMDGFTLCKTIKEKMSTAPYFILLTGQDSMCDLVAAMDIGADDFISKPFDSEELRVRLKAGVRIVEMRNQLRLQNQQLSDSLTRETSLNQQMQQDLKAAEYLQRALLPQTGLSVPGLKLAHYFHAASGVAGDTFNILPLTGHQVAFYHIDVAGHGVRSAMLSFNISRLLSDPNTREAICWSVDELGQPHPAPPVEVVDRLNARSQCGDDCKDYFTMIYGVLDLENGDGVFCQAGHPHPVIIPERGAPKQLGSGGLPVGLFETPDFEQSSFKLAVGDRLVVLSDGLFSCPLKNGRLFDSQILTSLMCKLKTTPLDKLQNKIQTIITNLILDRPAEDDISIMVMERTLFKKHPSTSNLSIQ